MSCHDNGGNVLLAFLAGAVTGAAVALLTAPTTGPDARDSLRGWARDAQGRATKVPSAVQYAARKATAAAKEAFHEALAEAEIDPDGPSEA